MSGRGRGRGRGRGTSLFINKDIKELLSAQGIGRADEIPPPLYDVSVMSMELKCLCHTYAAVL